MTPVDLRALRDLPFLRDAPADVLERLADVASERRFERGKVILHEGSSGSELYLIVEGRVEVVRGGEADEVLLAQRGPGDFFGEMGMIEHDTRFATVRALEPTHLLEFSEKDLRSVLARRPMILYEAVRVLSARLREADLQMISDLKRKNVELARAYRELQDAQAALVERERLEHELELARDLQQSILPQEFPDLPGLNCAARNRPARWVGGDFYDVIPLGGKRVGLVMADVSDKGMSAALYMALTRSLIRAEARHHASPRNVLLSTHRLLMEMTRANMFVTVFYGVLDLGKGMLRYARAGHDYPVLVDARTGECQTLTGHGMVLGCIDDVQLEEVSRDLHTGQLLVLYTDGITDANSLTGEFFGAQRLRETICSNREMTAKDVCDSVFSRVDRFQQGAMQYDDMALLVVRMT
ncbi:MAG: SpoIIE family protein phosphatase [Anaerolineae bacterium]